MVMLCNVYYIIKTDENSFGLIFIKIKNQQQKIVSPFLLFHFAFGNFICVQRWSLNAWDGKNWGYAKFMN